MRNYLYKDNSARIYMLFKFYRTAIILFNLFVPISVYSLFFYNLTFLISGSYFLCFLSFLLLCLFYYFVFLHSVFSVTLSLYHSVFPLILSLCYSVFLLILSLCHSVSFHLFVALPPPFFPSHFGFIFTLSSVYFLIFLPEYLSI